MSRQEPVLCSVPQRLYVDGEWIDGDDGTFAVSDPATGEVVAKVADGSAGDALHALDAAVRAQEGWAATTTRERADILHRAWELVQERAEHLAVLMTLEMGKPLREARGEVAYGGEFLRWFAEEGVRVDGRYTANPQGMGTMVVTHRPVGPCYLITPWNFPLAMATRKIAPALAAGCTAVVKPADLTPLTTLALTQIFEDAGLPAGVLNVVPTTRPQAVSDAILGDQRLRKVSFTGSTAVGVHLLKQAADNVLKTSMELGGNAPFVVFEDADLDLAVDAAMLAKFRNIGQACTAANRFYVHESVAEEFTRRITDRMRGLVLGPGMDENTDIGPLISDRAAANAERLVDEAVSHGAELVLGGRAAEGKGSFFEPTLLTGVTPSMAVSREEIFAPIVGIQHFRTEDEAVALANATQYGLVGYVFTQDARRGQQMIDRIDTGMMGLNVGVVSNAAAPFGGVKQSGLGREGGHEGIHEYLDTKYTLIPSPYL